MADWRLRDLCLEDLPALVDLDRSSSSIGEPPVLPITDVVTALTDRHPAVAATVLGELVGAGVAAIRGEHAWILRLSLSPDWRHQGLGTALLTHLEHRLQAAGVQRISALLPAEETGAQAFSNNGFVRRDGVSHYEKTESVNRHAATLLSSLGGAVPPAGLWEQVAGMVVEKETIEKKVVLPLAHPDVAEDHGVRPPHAIMLFGPPGTGKTTFARAVASRLGWPFVELFPSRLGGDEGTLPAGLNVAFEQIMDLDKVVVFIDEVEEIASARGSGATPVAVVNELLKALVSFRSRPHRLLVCATNSVRVLDPAFLRHGRFDYVLPIGPPDDMAREAMWRRHLQVASTGLEPTRLVAASDGFTPADIEHAARTAAQRIFERTMESGSRCTAEIEDYLDATSQVRPTLTHNMIHSFHEDIDAHARS